MIWNFSCATFRSLFVAFNFFFRFGNFLIDQFDQVVANAGPENKIRWISEKMIEYSGDQNNEHLNNGNI